MQNTKDGNTDKSQAVYSSMSRSPLRQVDYKAADYTHSKNTSMLAVQHTANEICEAEV